MKQELEQFVAETVAITGAAPPAVMAADAPVLRSATLRDDELYLIGLIGGKDVGKSALVNALVGHEITQRIGYGEGTGNVVAYAHARQAPMLSRLLDAEVPGQYRVVTHEIAELQGQALLDLPDIDSHWTQHVAITRRMLRHMIYPLWIQSIEKYADRHPQELLKAVAEGNAPANFIFCLNKVDQLGGIEAPGSGTESMRTEADAAELRDDYAQRIAGALGLARPPRVWMISAIRPDDFELPALRAMLSRARPRDAVQRSRELAAWQQGMSIVAWARQQDLQGRKARLDRLEEDAQDAVAERIGRPVLEEAIPGMIDDPAHRLAAVDQCMQHRAARWPIVNMVHAVAGPIVSVLRRRLALEQQRGLGGAEALVDLHLHGGGWDVATRIQSTFAQLQQTHAADVSVLYRQRKLWETMHADAAADELRRRLAGTLGRQRQVLVERFAGRDNMLGRFVRVALTWGAVLWFPIAQPVVQALLTAIVEGSPLRGGARIGLLIVQILSVTFLLKNAAFLLLWFGLIWAYLRWSTQRKVERQLVRWRSAEHLDPAINPTAAAMEWLNDLLAPIRTGQEKLQRLLDGLKRLEQDLDRSAA